jgi:hypothetical protein
LFAPIVRRDGSPLLRGDGGPPPALSAWRSITLEAQWQRFVRDTPLGEPSVLAREDFDAWGEAYLALDPASRTHTPAAVRTPSGPCAISPQRGAARRSTTRRPSAQRC